MSVQADLLQLAVQAAAIGAKALERFGAIPRSGRTAKSRNDWVTDADRSSETNIVAFLHREVPEHEILTEEAGQIPGRTASPYRWIIDPLDGTTNFMRRHPPWAVSIAVEHRTKPDLPWGEIIAGVVNVPPQNQTFHAGLGIGSFCNWERLELLPPEDFKSALIATGFPFRNPGQMGKYLKLFSDILSRCADVRRAGAAAVDLCHVAAGVVDGFWEFDLKPWDMAAGALIIREAGGRASDCQGGNDFLASGAIVAGNGAIYNNLLDLILGDSPEIISAAKGSY